MDSMVNRYTADRRLRHDDAYTAGGEGGKRPDRCTVVYAQRCREAFKGVPVVLGGIEASLRRIAHYDYWSDKARCWRTPRRTCCSTAMPSAPSSKWPTVLPPAKRRASSTTSGASRCSAACSRTIPSCTRTFSIPPMKARRGRKA
ncbi:hypothetical protein ACVW1A_002155 [Bradyrhizobium sp. LB1.3]